MGDVKELVSDETRFYKHVETLTMSQKLFIDLLKDWHENQRNMLILVSGGPGSGKTYTVIETLKFINYKAIKMAPTALIANKINGRTIHSTMKLNWRRGSTLNKIETLLEEENDVEKCLKTSKPLGDEMCCNESEQIIVMDEIGMVPFWFTYWIIRYFFNAKHGTLFIAMGDSRQLKPVKSQFNIFNVDFDKEFEIYRIQLQESKRFEPDYIPIIEELSKLVDEKNHVKLFEYVSAIYPVVESIDVNILKQCKRALVYKNSTVELYNKFYMSQLPGIAYRLYKIDNGKIDKTNYTDLKPGCEVVVTENFASVDNEGRYPIMNGSILIFNEYDNKTDRVICYDNYNQKVSIGRSMFTNVIPIVPNFAGTIHKFQGQTIDINNIVFNFNGCTDLHLIYTALSRVRSLSQILAVAL
ncbi:hypothetical protein HNY73_001041 [Argiope bruennichi]|uniref:Uncharacterized protein n=1 Tax=Argiope bruennichi TaxID=94029 RepID=A0A8T0G2H1_ARGBR|nr:hypothetical protein HNY73_001041 [Argiope bruennichi]